ncbi:MAG: Sensor histidine kinase RcsC [Spirochaetes bacterium ADurb.Bin110]|nr:MAG: Sensor histidine kinase RcsC [Spirochaetes bacterium ADurb.Bin110]
MIFLYDRIMSAISSQKKNKAKVATVLLSFLFCTLAIFFFVMLWKTANRSESELLETVSKRIALQISAPLQEMLTVGEDFRELLIADSGKTYAALRPLAEEALSHLPYIDSITIAPGAIVRYFFPEGSASSSIGHDLLDNPERMHALVEAVRRKSAVLQGPELSAEGKNLAFLRIPVIEGSELWGFVSIAFNADKVLSDLDLVSQFPGLSIAIVSSDMEGNGRKVFWGEERALSGYSAVLKIGSEDLPWTIYVASMYPYRQVAIWGAGLLILVLLSSGLIIRAGSLKNESKVPVWPKEASMAIKPFVPKTESIKEPSINVVNKVEIPQASAIEESMAQESAAEKPVSPSLKKPTKEPAGESKMDMAVLQNQKIENENRSDEVAVPKEEIPSSISVLVVDDSEVNRDLLLRMLTLKDYKAKAVSSGKAALQALSENIFDVLLVDCIMPEMDGYALAKEIHAKETSKVASSLQERNYLKYKPIAQSSNAENGISECGILKRSISQSDVSRPILIAMSPRHDQEEAEKCANAGFDSLLVKPFTMTALDQQIRLAIGNRSAE